MKQFCLYLLLLLSFCGGLHAQDIDSSNRDLRPRIRLGFMGGGGAGSLSSDALNETASDAYFFGGVFADFPIFRGISLHPEVFYLKDGYESETVLTNGYIDGIYNRKCLVMPLLVRYSFAFVKSDFIPYIQTGGVINYALDKEYKIRHTINEDGRMNIGYNTFQEKSDYVFGGFSIGGGLEIKIGSRHALFFDMRYCLNLDKEKNQLVFTTLSFNI